MDDKEKLERVTTALNKQMTVDSLKFGPITGIMPKGVVRLAQAAIDALITDERS